MAEAKWYAVHTYSGYETKVKDTLLKAIENRGLTDLIEKVEVPKQVVVEMKEVSRKKTRKNSEGETEEGPEKVRVKKEVEKKKFPGYVFIRMVLTDDTWYVVRNTRGVTGFVGPESKAVPLTDEEMLKVLERNTEVSFPYEVGDMVIITGGVWNGVTAAVQSVNPGKQSVTINMGLLGKQPVEFDITQIKKA